MTYDAVIAGLGGMGSAVLARAALRGARVFGVEQYGPVHDRGASAGKTRLIRQAYYEDPAYVPLLLRAYELWHDLERRSGEELLRITGLIMAGTEDAEIVTGSAATARKYGMAVEYLGAADMRSRYPALHVRDEEVGVFEAGAGVVFPERAIHAHLDVARAAGAQMRFDAAVTGWDAQEDRVTVNLSDGMQVRARALVLAVGPWSEPYMREAGVPFEVQRNVQVWFSPRTHAYDDGAFPAFLIERADFPAPLYGFPDFGDGVKAAFHGLGELTQPDNLRREIDVERDVQPVAQALETWMPGAAGSYRDGKACMYALTPDRNFVVDRHPQHANVVLLGGFSGHGFKFTSVIGEVGADLALERGTAHDIGFLSLKRFSNA